MAQPTAERHRFIVAKEDERLRLDQLLAAHVPNLSRGKARVLLDIGGVFVDGTRVKVASRMLRAGQKVEAHIGGALDRATKDVGKAARARDEAQLPDPVIVYQDDEIVVVDKPARMITAPTPESDRMNLADTLKRKLGGVIFVVQRLDLGTSGLLVLARTPDANRVLSERIREHDFERGYIAVLRGVVTGDEQWTMRTPVENRRAVTHFERLEVIGDRATVVRAQLETGRTHQIRIHANHCGHPVLGDRLHGGTTTYDPPRLALHAARLGFVHPRTGEKLNFESDLPKDLAEWLDRLRG